MAKNIRAPRVGKEKEASIQSGASTSFETYFLRSLYSQGSINEESIAQIAKAEKINLSTEEIVASLKETDVESISQQLADSLSIIASAIVRSN